MKYDSLIVYTAGIIMIAISVLLPFADVLDIQIPKTITIASVIFVAIILIGIFSAGLAEDLNISLPKGLLAFIYYIFGFFGGSLFIIQYLGISAFFIFVTFNGVVFYAISARND